MLEEKFDILKNMLSLNLESETSIETLLIKLSSLPNIKLDCEAYQNEKLVFRFRDEGKEYIFKYDPNYPPENEIFFAQIARFLGVDVVSNEIVELGSLRGIFQESPHRRETHYVEVEDLLQLLPAEEKNEDYFENIEKALNIRYRNIPNGAQLVQNLMNKIIRITILNIVLGIPEFPTWTLQETQDGTVDITPIEPKKELFGGLLRRKRMSNDEQREILKTTFLRMNDIIDKLASSSRNDTPKLIESLWVLKRNNIEELFEQLDGKANREIRRILQIKYITMCKSHLDFLMDTLGIEKLPVSKDIDLDYILAMTNQRQFKDGEIAASIITPMGVNHVAAIEAATAHHEELFQDIYNRIYKEEATNIHLGAIKIHHISRDSTDRQAIVHVPYYITPYEYSQLSKILIKLNDLGIEILADQTGFDPINGCFCRGSEEEFTGLEILDYLKTNDFIVDYSWQIKNIHLDNEQARPIK